MRIPDQQECETKFEDTGTHREWCTKADGFGTNRRKTVGNSIVIGEGQKNRFIGG